MNWESWHSGPFWKTRKKNLCHIWYTNCLPFASNWVHPRVLCESVLLIVFSFVWCVVVFVFFYFLFCILCPELPVTLYCPFLIVLSDFSNVYNSLFNTGQTLHHIECDMPSVVFIIIKSHNKTIWFIISLC